MHNKILDRLEKVRPNGKGQYRAKCPCRDHRSGDQTLSIGIMHDGRTLINCHAGCEALDILGAIGLGLTDLYPERQDHHLRPHWLAQEARREKEKTAAILNHEKRILRIAANDRAAGKRLSLEDMARERLAFDRVRQLVGDQK